MPNQPTSPNAFIASATPNAGVQYGVMQKPEHVEVKFRTNSFTQQPAKYLHDGELFPCAREWDIASIKSPLDIVMRISIIASPPFSDVRDYVCVHRQKSSW